MEHELDARSFHRVEEELPKGAQSLVTKSRPLSPPPPPPPPLDEEDTKRTPNKRSIVKKPFLKKGSRDWSYRKPEKKFTATNSNDAVPGKEKNIPSSFYEGMSNSINGQARSSVKISKSSISHDHGTNSTPLVRRPILDNQTQFDQNAQGSSKYVENEAEEEDCQGRTETKRNSLGSTFESDFLSGDEIDEDEDDYLQISKHAMGTDRSTSLYVEECIDSEEHEEEEEEEGVEEEGKVHSGALPESANRPKISRLVQKMFRTLDPIKVPEKKSKSFDEVIPKHENSKEQEPKKSLIDTSEIANKLQEEMKKFEAANQQVNACLEKLQADQRDLDRDRRQFYNEKSLQEKEELHLVKKMQEELRKEQAHLRKERIALEKSRQHIELMRTSAKLDKKDKAQVESLQATIAQLRLAERERASKHKDALRLKSERIVSLEQQVRQLNEALKFAEARRLDLWEKQQHTQANYEALESRFQELFRQQNKGPKNDDDRPVEEEEDIQQAHDSSKNVPVAQEQSDYVDAINQFKDQQEQSKKQSSSRRQVILHEDGTKEVIFSNGTRKETLPSGESTTTFISGDIKKVIPEEGIEIYYFCESDTTQTTFADGMVVVEFPNGQRERTLPNKTLEVFYPDGTFKMVSPDGTEETTFPDGTKVKQGADGRRTVIRDGN